MENYTSVVFGELNHPSFLQSQTIRGGNSRNPGTGDFGRPEGPLIIPPLVFAVGSNKGGV